MFTAWLLHWLKNALPVWIGGVLFALIMEHFVDPKRPTLYFAASYAFAMFVVCTLIQTRSWMRTKRALS